MRSPSDEQTGAASSPWYAAGRERPVFLDERGRRHRLLRPFAVLAVLLTAGWLAGLVVGATGFATLAPLRPAVAGRTLPALTRPPRKHHALPQAPARPRLRPVAATEPGVARPAVARTDEPAAPTVSGPS